jgi:phosphoglycolate phosphatase-like HAD superfamily hydrolase
MLIIFDIDGTLTNTKSVDDKCFKWAFEEIFGIDIECQNWEDLNNVTDWGITEEIILRDRNRLPTSKEYETLTANFIDKLNVEFVKDSTQFDAVRGAKQFLDYLKQRGYKISIATGGWRLSAEMKLKASGLYVEDIPCANSTDYKTREEIIQHSIRLAEVKYNCKFRKVIYFGDGAWDYATSRKLGLQFIGLDTAQNDKLKMLGAEHVFEDYMKVELIGNILSSLEH